MKLNDHDYAEPLPAPAQPQPKKINLAVLLIVAAVFITTPVCIFALGYLWLTQSSFNSVNEIKADEVDEIKIQMLNLRRGPQNRPDPIADENLKPEENTPYFTDPDIDPTLLVRPDFDAFLGSLRGAEKVERKDVPAVAFLGEVKIRYKDGRRGTIYLKQSDDRPGPHATAMVWMNINSNWYRAGTLKELRTVAQACADRGQKVVR
jgi:hypothetical protein